MSDFFLFKFGFPFLCRLISSTCFDFCTNQNQKIIAYDIVQQDSSEFLVVLNPFNTPTGTHSVAHSKN